jgi:hypothetical protein
MLPGDRKRFERDGSVYDARHIWSQAARGDGDNADPGRVRLRRISMSTRTSRKTVIFGKPFLLEGIGRSLPAGRYEIVTDEELIEGLSFPVYRRVATMMLVPALLSRSSIEMVTIDAADLLAAIKRDASAVEGDNDAAKVRR